MGDFGALLKSDVVAPNIEVLRRARVRIANFVAPLLSSGATTMLVLMTSSLT